MGIYYKLLEHEKDLHSWIYELEQDRVNNDLLNHSKYNELYKIYYGVCDEINKSHKLIK